MTNVVSRGRRQPPRGIFDDYNKKARLDTIARVGIYT